MHASNSHIVQVLLGLIDSRTTRALISIGQSHQLEGPRAVCFFIANILCVKVFHIIVN
jgi:hypothetical protein